MAFIENCHVMTFCFILGTRPEIIKLSPLIRLAQARGVPFFILHTGQHYSYELDDIFFEDLGLPVPAYNLNIASGGSNLQGEHTGRMLIDIEKVLLKEKPDVVFVQGDTNTVLAGALAVCKLRTSPSYFTTRLCHIEAGLRSYDHTMTEEINRTVADQLCDYLFVPSDLAKTHLLMESIPEDRIFVTGNTIVDAVRHVEQEIDASKILSTLGLAPREYIFATVHRQENVDNEQRFRNIFEGFRRVFALYQIPIVYSRHPRSEKMMERFVLYLPDGVRAISPVGFVDALHLEKNARLIMTDSGGIQEEASILQIPCVTLRENTERTETTMAGVNIISGADPAKILEAVSVMMVKSHKWRPLYGEGNSAEKILDIVFKHLV